MISSQRIEHFCTLFDSHYLLLGMALHQSLMAHTEAFHLWILCMDEEVEQSLAKLDLAHVSLIPLREIETQELLAVKPERSRGEYCWTLTPFVFEAVFKRDHGVERVTYLDADLFFFDNPALLLQELRDDRHVLITEHAYAPEYDQSITSGRFCVQFLTFRRTNQAHKVMHWWQERCLEWCFNRLENGKFGDQMYLDQWPILFPDEIQIVKNVEKTLAPWNVSHFEKKRKKISPVFFHFHGVKLVAENRAQLFLKYKICHQGSQLYEAYLQALSIAKQKLDDLDIPVKYFPLPQGFIAFLRRWKWLILNETRFGKLKSVVE